MALVTWAIFFTDLIRCRISRVEFAKVLFSLQKEIERIESRDDEDLQ